MINQKLFLLLCCCTQVYFKLPALAYVYPVATDENSIFYIYQKSLADLELWRAIWSDNSLAKSASFEKCLYWRFIPAGLTLLPEHQGFSFIDSGRLWVKNFIKRSPCAISFDQPVFNISEVCWLDQQTCYFSAKQNQKFMIFMGNAKQQQLKILYDSSDSECLSPRIIAKQLFCIERHKQDRNCMIIRLDLDSNYYLLKQSLSKRVLIDCGYQQVIYLQMCSNTLGFYVEHMPYISDESQVVTLVCHKIALVDSDWISTKLFKFVVPKSYLFGEQRLYESILPFLPRVKKTCLYFSDIKQNQSGEYYSSLFEFDLISLKKFAILKSEPGAIYFAPLIGGQDLFYGKVLPNSPEETPQIGQLKSYRSLQKTA